MLLDETVKKCYELIHTIEFYDLTRKINIFFSVIILFIGLIGNSLAVFVFFQRRCRTHSSSIYFLFLCLFDGLFLIVHFFEDTLRTYIDVFLNDQISSLDAECIGFKKLSLTNGTVKYSLLRVIDITDHYNFSCKFVNYLRYVLRFASAYIIVILTIQRTLAIYFPFFQVKFKSKKLAWLYVFCIFILSLLINSWVPFLFGLTQDISGVKYCDIKKEFSKEYFFLTIFYTVLIMFLPILIIIFSNCLIMVHLLKAVKQREEMVNYQITSSSNSMYYLSDLNTVVNSKEISTRLSMPRLSRGSMVALNVNNTNLKISKHKNKSNQITRLLLLMSFSYIILNLPYFLSWCLFFYQMGIRKNNNYILKYKLFSFLNLSEILYILNYSVHFFVYCASGQSFRNQLKNALNIKKDKKITKICYTKYRHKKNLI